MKQAIKCPLRHCKCCLQDLFCVINDKWNQICQNNKYKSCFLSLLITFPSKHSVCRQDEARTQNEFVSVYGRLQSVLDYLLAVLTGCLFATYVTQHQLWMQMYSSKCHFPSTVQVFNSCWGTRCSMEGPRARLWSFNNWGLAVATAKAAICCMQAFPVRGTEQSPNLHSLQVSLVPFKDL